MIRPATPDDAAAIAGIYGPYCEQTTVSFEAVAPSVDEMATRIRKALTAWAWVVDDVDGAIAGYAYASRHRERAAYRWAVDTAVYVDRRFMRRGIGRALYLDLFDRLQARGYYRACAGIALPNDASLRLHEAVGFTPVGVYRNIGYKQGAWRDVAWYQRDLQPPDASSRPPAEPVLS